MQLPSSVDPLAADQDAPPAAPEKSAGELPRRAMLGARLGPVTPEIRDRHGLPENQGVVLEQVFDGTAAAAAGLRDADIVLEIGDTEVTGITVLLAAIAEARAGDALTLSGLRDGAAFETAVTLQEFPRERGDGYDVVYSFVMTGGVRLRTIITRPRTAGRHPAVMLLQGGHTCFPIDDPIGAPSGFVRIAQGLAQHGYVTLRIERPGCGDSEGGPLRDVDFETELEGNRQALRTLRQLEFVDADNVFLFGHSMGGIMAPLMAADLPVRGIAVFGTASGTWFESVFGQRRRLAALDGTPVADVDREIREQARFWYPLLIERLSPREIRARDPELSAQVWQQWITDDKYVGDRHFRFHHQLAAINLAEAWTKVASTTLSGASAPPSPPARTEPMPRVLAMWGTSDWLATRDQASWIAEVVNRQQPGQARCVVLDGIDHFFFRTASPEDSYRLFSTPAAAATAEFNPIVVESLCDWLDEVVAG
jgi:alpha-beta hydrolase superfamily lysophospholipase